MCDREEVYGLAGLTRRRGDAKKTGAGTFLSPQTHRKTEQGTSMYLSAWQSGSGGASLRSESSEGATEFSPGRQPWVIAK